MPVPFDLRRDFSQDHPILASGRCCPIGFTALTCLTVAHPGSVLGFPSRLCYHGSLHDPFAVCDDGNRGHARAASLTKLRLVTTKTQMGRRRSGVESEITPTESHNSCSLAVRLVSVASSCRMAAVALQANRAVHTRPM